MADSEPAEAAAGTAPEEVQAEDVSADEVVAAESEPSDGDYPDGSEDAATPEVLSPSYRPPRDPVTLGTYVALKACKVRSMPDMDSEEEGTYMKGDSFEITEAVEISIKGEAPKVRAKTSMGWITVADNVELKVEETPREQKTDNKLGEYLVISKKGIKVRKGAELDSEPLEYPLDEGAVFEVKEVKLIESTNKKGTTTDVLRGRYADGWVSLKDGMVEHLDVAAMSPGRSPMKGGRRGSVAQDGPSQVMAEAARVALEEGAEAEKIFEVTQGHIKKKGKAKISENVQLKVGAMNVQIFDGPLPVETYLYTMIKRWQISKEKQRIVIFFNDDAIEKGIVPHKYVRLTTLPGQQEQIADLMTRHARQIKKVKTEKQELEKQRLAAIPDIADGEEGEEAIPPVKDVPEAEPPNTCSVQVLSARGLAEKDGVGKSDPYVVVKIGDMKNAEGFKTEPQKNTLEPTWSNELFRFEDVKPDDVVKVLMFDGDAVTKDDPMGKVTIEVSAMTGERAWVKLEPFKSAKSPKGEIQLCCTFGTPKEVPFPAATNFKIGKYKLEKKMKLRQTAHMSSDECGELDLKEEVDVLEAVRVPDASKKGAEKVRVQCAKGWFSMTSGAAKYVDPKAASAGNGKGKRKYSVSMHGIGEATSLGAQQAAALGAEPEDVFNVKHHEPLYSKKSKSEVLQLKVGGMGIDIFDGPTKLEGLLYTKIARWTINAKKEWGNDKLSCIKIEINQTTPGKGSRLLVLGCPEGNENEVAKLMKKHATGIAAAKRSSPRKGDQTANPLAATPEEATSESEAQEQTAAVDDADATSGATATQEAEEAPGDKVVAIEASDTVECEAADTDEGAESIRHDVDASAGTDSAAAGTAASETVEETKPSRGFLSCCCATPAADYEAMDDAEEK